MAGIDILRMVVELLICSLTVLTSRLLRHLGSTIILTGFRPKAPVAGSFKTTELSADPPVRRTKFQDFVCKCFLALICPRNINGISVILYYASQLKDNYSNAIIIVHRQ